MTPPGLKLDPKRMRTLAIMVNAVSAKVVLIVGGFYLGRWLDRSYGTAPYGVTIGLCLGLALGLWVVIRAATKNLS